MAVKPFNQFCKNNGDISLTLKTFPYVTFIMENFEVLQNSPCTSLNFVI